MSDNVHAKSLETMVEIGEESHNSWGVRGQSNNNGGLRGRGLRGQTNGVSGVRPITINPAEAPSLLS